MPPLQSPLRVAVLVIVAVVLFLTVIQQPGTLLKSIIVGAFSSESMAKNSAEDQTCCASMWWLP